MKHINSLSDGFRLSSMFMGGVKAHLLTRLFTILTLAFFATGAAWAENVTTYVMQSYSNKNNNKVVTDDQGVLWTASTAASSANQLPANISATDASGRGVCFSKANSVTLVSDMSFSGVSKIVVECSQNGNPASVGIKVGDTNLTSEPKSISKGNHQRIEVETNSLVSGQITLTLNSTSSIWIGALIITTETSGTSTDLTPAALAFTPNSVECAVDDVVEIAFSKSTDAEVTFTSSDETVATYEDGAVYAYAAGTTTITAHSDATEDYAEGTATLTVTVLPVADNIAAFKTSTEKTVLKLNDAVVTAVQSNNKIFIEDATGGIRLDVVSGFEVGDVLTGTLIGTNASNNGLTVTNYASVAKTSGDAPTPTVLTIDNLVDNWERYAGCLVKIEGAQCPKLGNNATISQNGNTNIITFYNTFGITLPSCQNFDITGIAIVYGTTKELAPRTADDIVEVEGEKITTLTFGQESYTFYVGDEISTITATVNSGAAITYTSSDEDVLMIDSQTGEIMAITTGTVVVTATVDAYNGYPAASETVNVTVKAVPQYVMLVAQRGDGKYYALSSNEGSASKSLDAVEVTVVGGKVVVEELDHSLLWNVDVESGYITSYAGAYLSAPGNNTDLVTSDKAKQWTYDSDNGYWKISSRAVIYNIGGYFKTYSISNINGSGYGSAVVEMPYVVGASVTIGTSGFSTLYYSNKNLIVPKNVSAYTYVVSNDDLALFSFTDDFETNVIPAATGVVLYTTTPDTYVFEQSNSATPIDADFNSLCGTDEAGEVTVTDGVPYILGKGSQGIAFYQAAVGGGKTFNNGAHKAYLVVPTGSEVRGYFSLGIGDMETSIREAVAAKQNGEVYNLSGVRVKGMNRPGLYIVNGKKIVK